MRIVNAVALAGFLIVSGNVSAGAEELDEALSLVCEKIKTCAYEQMEGVDDMSKQMKQMIEAQLETMCDGIKATYTGFGASAHPLFEPAKACLVSMGTLSCQRLQEGGDAPTPECAELKNKAEAYD